MTELLSNPCEERCRFNGDIMPDDSLCLVCGMTPLEKARWPLLSDSKREEMAIEIYSRIQTMWLMWEMMEEPTIQ